MNNCQGYSLFNDVKDIELRNKNRGGVMANIFEDYGKGGSMSAQGSHTMMQYFTDIPPLDRSRACSSFTDELNKRGYNIDV